MPAPNKGRAGWGFRTFFEKWKHGYTATAKRKVHGSGTQQRQRRTALRANSQQACRCSLRESGAQRASL
jgi:hypothetical protein